ncbi:hypothetical protein ACWFR1_03115 [Streptomyces sp. NPDC055103]
MPRTRGDPRGLVRRVRRARIPRPGRPDPISRTIVTPGYDPAPEIAATLAEYEAHQEEKGRQKSSAAKRAWQERADALDNRMAMLKATPARPETREVTPTGRTLADEWAEADDEARRPNGKRRRA